jgi:sec-independent protein translocase protein TatB
MLDFGWAELFLIMALAVLVIGPDEIPSLMRGLGNLVRRFQYMKYAISRQFDEFMDLGDVEDLRNAVNFEAKRPSGHEGFDEAAEDASEDVVPANKRVEEASDE